MTDKNENTLTCEKHGEMPWEGHVKCITCGRVYCPPWQGLDVPAETIKVPEAPHPFCDCGAVLFPTDRPFRCDGGHDHKAVAICSGCYIDVYPRAPGHDDGPATPETTN